MKNQRFSAAAPILTTVRRRACTRRLALAAALLLVGAGLAAQTGNTVSTPGANRIANSALEPAGRQADNLISPDDVLDIYVVDAPEFSRPYRVSPAGMIAVPMVEDPVPAAGLRLSDLARRLQTLLREKGLVSAARVTVSIASSRGKSVAITGAVRHPQVLQLFSRTTMLDVLSQAEGLSPDAGSIAAISRGDAALAAKAGESTVTVDLVQLLQKGDPAANVDIYPGDRITVPRSGMVYVVGAVQRPGGFPLSSVEKGMTVLQAIALASDLKATAVRAKAMIVRRNPAAADGREQLPLDLKRILAGKAADPVLQADDILFVPDSGSAKAMRRGAEAAIQTVVLLAGYGRW